MSNYSATLAVIPDGSGNWSLTSTAPGFPPIAIPGAMFPTAQAAQHYAGLLLSTDGHLDTKAPKLRWHPIGYTTDLSGERHVAYRVCFPARHPAPTAAR